MCSGISDREIVEIRRTRIGPREQRVEFLTAEDVEEQARLSRWVHDAQNCTAVSDGFASSSVFDIRALWVERADDSWSVSAYTPAIPLLDD